MQREHLLRACQKSTIRWVSQWGEDSICVGALLDTLVLEYSADGDHVVEKVSIDWTSCNLGGQRPWFKCPGCDRRCALLYLASDEFRCRLCHGLTYTTSQASEWIRRMRKSNHLRARLEVELGDRLIVKPHGMHWSTFHRLVDQYRATNAASWLAFRPILDRMDSETQEFRRQYDSLARPRAIR
jgi:hypothetical protein